MTQQPTTTPQTNLQIPRILESSPDTDRQIKKLVKQIRMRRAWIAAHEAKIDTLRQDLRCLLEQSGKSWSDDEGYARLVDASERISYETKGLDALIITQPDVYGCLNAYRKVTPIKPSLSVK